MSIKSSISDYLKIDELKENFIKLIEAKFELKKLEVQEKAEDLISELIVKLVLAFFLFIIFILLNVLLALTINYYSNSIWIGFAALIGIYMIVWFVFNAQKQRIADTVGQKVKEAMDKF
ncbi:hypothetical protein EGI22_01525 [Lacihabitans sp. LS3-19]|uniref:phage holin family protein n=1 Tax=Lacihabitans sp. LS3-19 TaxID=2487335 RepID=UPI0020CE7840|nr:phage holin family protein [Lacihabitans sp. LS3-19]MCP9766568.1 hypothetical protein [Lacihabitans sp. LS3-19]